MKIFLFLAISILFIYSGCDYNIPSDSFLIGNYEEGDEFENDNLKEQASELIVNSIQIHTIHNKSDYDYMKIDVKDYLTYSIQTTDITGFYPEISLYHEEENTPFLSISPFLDDWKEEIIYIPQLQIYPLI